MEGDIAMNAIEVLEERIGSVSTREGDMPMMLCKETMDISYLSPARLRHLSRTPSRERKSEELLMTGSMLMELCEEENEIGE